MTRVAIPSSHGRASAQTPGSNVVARRSASRNVSATASATSSAPPQRRIAKPVTAASCRRKNTAYASPSPRAVAPSSSASLSFT
jgi:hypothetical protein